ncbi:MAG: thiamine-phosphate kinase [Flavobacteriales bacterium]|nr:thiamine-phosphate kinase [Flavobacteriales bacterium]
MFENSEKTTLESLGEFGLIEHLKKHVVLHHPETIMGIGDDGAVIQPENKQVIITTDMLTEGIHFDLRYVPLKHLGYKAVAVNLSDIYAMNGKPTHITVSIAVSSKYTLEAIEELYSGINLACSNYKVDLIGGDTTSSMSGLTISITAVGIANPDEIVYRNGAKKGDLICVTGNLGAAYAGLQLLEREKQIFLENTSIQPDLEGHDYILEKQLKPEPRADIIRQMKELGFKPTAMIDISDGLASEILHICKASVCGCRIDAEKIPIDQDTWNMAEELNMSAITMALYGGEEYELLMTIRQEDYEKARMIADLHVIGYITDTPGACYFIDSKNELHPITASGWDHFSK